MIQRLPSKQVVTALKAAGEPTRLRILALLAGGELNVKDLTQVLGQSQPRISRHLKLLVEAGLIERFREGSWVYFHIGERSEGGQLALRLLAEVDGADPAHERDRDRAGALKREREAAAQAYFQQHAKDWDRIRALHVPDTDVEATMREVLGSGPFNLLVDLGTGTGRMLELFAPSYARGLGLDINQAMLAFARTNISRAGNTKAQVRQGDLYDLPLGNGAAGAVIMHQVLHFLSDPPKAIAEASRVLAPGGRLLIVDFAPHDLEFLREEYAHARLGFADDQMQQWLAAAGLESRPVRLLDRAEDDQPGKLTLSFWLATKGAEDTRAKGRAKKMLATEEAR